MNTKAIIGIFITDMQMVSSSNINFQSRFNGVSLNNSIIFHPVTFVLAKSVSLHHITMFNFRSHSSSGCTKLLFVDLYLKIFCAISTIFLQREKRNDPSEASHMHYIPEIRAHEILFQHTRSLEYEEQNRPYGVPNPSVLLQMRHFGPRRQDDFHKVSMPIYRSGKMGRLQTPKAMPSFRIFLLG